MQEFAIILSSLAGVATAAAIRKTPRNKAQLLTIGASAHIKSQINSLKIEKDILTKTISRLYQTDSEFSKIQRDKLLIKYQHQLGVILAKLEKLEAASKHPDLGPVGDGLISLMDQKLSKLDDRLYDLSSKLSSASGPIPETKKEIQTQIPTTREKPPIKPEQKEEPTKAIPFIFEKPKPVKSEPIVIPPTRDRQVFEITTLTSISKKEPKFPLFEKKIPEKQEIIQEVIEPKKKEQEKIKNMQTVLVQKPISRFETKPDLEKEVEKISRFKALPEPPKKKSHLPNMFEDDFDDDSDDIDKIKGEILNVLSKLDQAEVE